LTKHFPPRLARIAISFKFVKSLVQRLPFGSRWLVATDEVSLVQFGKARKQLRAFARAKLWKLFQDFRFAHRPNVSCTKATRKPIQYVESGRWNVDFKSRILNPSHSMPATTVQNETIRLSNLSNEEFLKLHASPGRIGLSGGLTLVDQAICRAERHLDEKQRWALWSHAFVFQGTRADGYHWVIESDLQVHHKHIQLGVQENRVSKYYDEKLYTNLAVLDFGLSEEHVTALLREGLELVATRAKYSVRELLGTLIALRRQELRARTNVLARESSMYCSAFVQHLFRKMGLELAPGIDGKNTTPEDISRSPIPHVTYLLERQAPRSPLDKLRRHAKARVRLLKRAA
jgi:hypothetical protein